MGRTSGAAVRIYQITYIVGFFLGCLLHMVVNKLFPPPGLGISEPFEGTDSNGGSIIEGVAPSSDDGHGISKQPIASETKVPEHSVA
jgi:NCS1 family nucleobase:cation symporter-1